MGPEAAVLLGAVQSACLTYIPVKGPVFCLDQRKVA